MLAVAITGTLLQREAALHEAPRPAELGASARIVRQYVPLLLVNWGLVLYVSRLFRAHSALPELLGQRWNRATRVAVDLALAVGLALTIELIESVCARYAGMRPNASVAALLPRTAAERVTWLVVALSVGFCEEVVYRGYLQTQLAAFTGRPSWGIVLQALLFGLAHGEQGLGAALHTALYGLLLGVLARSRRSLLPGVVCHVGIDLMSGWLR
jgi:membrane protease YdiL (CAAX protease family)